jgi:AraC-like DNA-binding protein
LRELSVQLEILEIRVSPGQEWSAESNQWRFIFLESGTAYWLEPVKPRELARGELLIVGPATQCVIRASQLAEVVLHWFGFRPKALLGFLSVAERERIENSATSALGSANCLPSTHPLSTEMAALHDCRHTDSQLVKRAKTLLLALRFLAQSMPALDAALRRGGGAKQRFDEIISRMPDTELVQHSSQELAQLCGCTPRHFNRLFRRRFGTPTRARQTELRLLKARQLLETSAEPVAHIAADCGYHSLSLFNSLFRRRFGMSPSEWRNKASG